MTGCRICGHRKKDHRIEGKQGYLLCAVIVLGRPCGCPKYARADR
jgi:hypothetical protein